MLSTLWGAIRDREPGVGHRYEASLWNGRLHQGLLMTQKKTKRIFHQGGVELTYLLAIKDKKISFAEAKRKEQLEVAVEVVFGRRCN